MDRYRIISKKGRIYTLSKTYEEEMKQFNKNVDKFFDAGKLCFLKDGEKEGENETVYLHTLKFYI